MTKTNLKGLLLVANWDSNVGYAWWLMESFWVVLSELYKGKLKAIIPYPSISTVPEAIANADIELFEMDFSKTSFSDVIKQCRFILQHKIRVVYFSDQAFWHWRYLFFRLCGVKLIVVHDHTPGLRTAPTGLKRLIKMIFPRIPFINCDAIIGVTRYIRQRAVDVACIPPRRTYFATNGLPEPIEVPVVDIRSEFNIPAQQKILVSTGRANKYKGVPFAIDCINKVVNEHQHQNIHFLFCGDGPDLEEFQTQINSLNLQSHVTLAGRRSDIAGILPACDFAIHPSAGEVGYSLSILEYMRAKLPVIVSDNPSVCGATVNNETGLIYREGDIESATNAILRLLDETELATTLGNNALDAVQEFTLAKTHEALVQSFRAIDPQLAR